MRAAVAATSSRIDADGFRVPAGHVHAWLPNTSQTLCGRSLERSGLGRFSNVDWADVQPAMGRGGDRVAAVCPQCAAVMGRKRDTTPWVRHHPRP